MLFKEAGPLTIWKTKVNYNKMAKMKNFLAVERKQKIKFMNLKSPILACPLLSPKKETTDENIMAAMKLLSYPVGVTLKKDGIRALRLNGSLLSRTFKKIPNKKIREASLVMPSGFDMELWNKDLPYYKIESIVMSREHDDWEKIQFHVLDWFGETIGYRSRMECIMKTMELVGNDKIKFAPPIVCENAEQLFSFFLAVEQECGEGICFRTLNSPYKQGRSTLREQYLVKLCRFLVEEAVIVGFEEQMANCNPVSYNAVGKMDRASDQHNMVGKNTLGVLVVNYKEEQLRIGTGLGLDDKLRKKIWENKEKYLGKTITFKYKPHGQKTLPKSPVFQGFREEGF